MTAKVMVLYSTPTDPDTFDAYYVDHHLPLVRAVPGLRSAATGVGPIGGPEGPAPYYQVSTYTWDSMEELQHALGSAEGVAAAGDLSNSATGGATLLIFEEQVL